MTSKRASRSVKGGAKRASHDPATPPALIDFMLSNWRAPKHTAIKPIDGLSFFKARRRRLSKAFPDELLIIPTGQEKVRANDTTFHFRAGSDFYYLTGNLEPDCVLVMLPKAGGGHEDILYVEPNPGRSKPTFFTDRSKGELWVGPRMGVPESKRRFGVARAASLEDLPAFIKSLRKGRKVRLLRGLDAAIDRSVSAQPPRDQQLASFLSEQRLIKDAHEVKMIRQACVATRRGYEDVVATMKTAKNEREIEGAFKTRARVEGNDVGYNTIAAAGAHACILHWVNNDGPLKKGDLLLVDAGIESRSLYTADLTRTLPISGRFSKPQREAYDLVVEAQRAAIAAIKPGVDFLAPNRAAMKVLAHGLERLGILPMSAEEALREDNQFYRRYTLHNVSHMLGIDVHDCANARQDTYRSGRLKAGMVFTVEPGLYFQLDDMTVPKRYRGIGIRIEDDILVTKTGRRVLSDVPRESSKVEAWIADIWRRR